MTRRTLISIAVLSILGLIAPASALAKEVSAVTICGADECRPVRDQRLLPELAGGSAHSAGPAERSAFYRVRVRVDAGEKSFRFENVVLPDQDLLRGESGTWMELSRFAGIAYRKLTDDMKPLPAAQMPLGAGHDPPEARVVEVVEAPAPPARDGRAAWPVAAALAALVVCAGLLARRGRHPRGPQPA